MIFYGAVDEGTLFLFHSRLIDKKDSWFKIVIMIVAIFSRRLDVLQQWLLLICAIRS